MQKSSFECLDDDYANDDDLYCNLEEFPESDG
jgi:hypothetical protein